MRNNFPNNLIIIVLFKLCLFKNYLKKSQKNILWHNICYLKIIILKFCKCENFFTKLSQLTFKIYFLSYIYNVKIILCFGNWF